MTAAARADPWRGYDERGYPAIIAHAAGNTAKTLAIALDSDVDYVEVDVWFRSMDFDVRHERRLGRFPLLYEKWYLSRPPSTPFTLLQLFESLDGRAGVFLDIKNGHREAAETVAAILESAPAGTQVAASSQWWRVLRHLHEIAPQIPLFYSVDAEAKLDLFRSVVLRDHRPAGVSCRATLLTEPIVQELKSRGLRVAAWTVDDLSRAAQLASWGVDGITTHHPGDVHTLLTAAL
jgi:glycerophosphoryl diester phosphodiesterase